MNNTILTDEEKEIFKKLVRPEMVVNISRYYLLDSERILIRYKDKSFMDIPAIEFGINKCHGMEKDKNYTLRELGLLTRKQNFINIAVAKVIEKWAKSSAFCKAFSLVIFKI